MQIPNKLLGIMHWWYSADKRLCGFTNQNITSYPGTSNTSTSRSDGPCPALWCVFGITPRSQLHSGKKKLNRTRATSRILVSVSDKW